MVTSVVIVGSGFTGFECARRVARRLRRDRRRHDDHLAGRLHALHAAAAGRGRRRGRCAICRHTAGGDPEGVRDIRGRVDRVDLEQHRLQFTDLEQRTRELSWDRLVLTPGSVTRLFDIPGLAQYARGLKSTAEALYLRDHVLEQLELSCLENDAELAQARRTIVVVGASYSGTELVLQLRALATPPPSR